MSENNPTNGGPPLWRQAASELARQVPYTPRVVEASAPQEELPPEKPNYIKALLGHKLALAAGLLIGLALGLAVTLVQIPMYHAGTTLEVLPINEQFMGMSTFDPQAGSYTINNMFALTQLRIMVSPSQLKRVRVRVNLETPPLTPPSDNRLDRLRIRLGMVPRDAGMFTRMAIDMAEKTASAKVLGSTRLVEVTSESPSPEVAAAFANLLGAEYISRNSELRTGAASDTLQWLQSQLEEARNRHEVSEAKFEAYVKEQGLAFVLDQNTLADSKLRTLQADLATQQSDRISKQARYEMAKNSPPDSLPETLDDGTLAKMRTQLNDQKQELANLLATLTPAHYKVKRVEAQIAMIEANMQKQRDNQLRRIQNEYEASLNRERLMSAAYGTQARSVAAQSGKANQYNALKREAELAKGSYNTLLQQYNQAVISTAVPTNNVRLIEPAIPDRRFPKPDATSTIAAGGIGGFIVVALGVILLQMLHYRNMNLVFAGPGRANRVLNLPELGVIPTLETTPRRSAWLRLKGKRAGLAENGHAAPTMELAPKGYGHSLLEESIRFALTSILARLENQYRLVLVVTSPGPREGKTTLVSHLAAATAQAGRLVLLIDADLRRPQIHRRFKLPLEGGLAEILRSNAPIESVVLTDYIKPTADPRLFVLTAGTIMRDEIGRALFSPRLAELLFRLREEYDAVLVDTSPTLFFPDARLVGRYCDGAVLVVRSNVTERESALAAKERLEQDNISVIGTILNDWDPSTGVQSSAYRYQHFYNDADSDGQG